MIIRDSITNYYKADYQDYYANNTALIDKSISAVQTAFSDNTFPSMKVSYDVYPEHIGHLESDGCFRCHNDAFVASDGSKISKDCNLMPYYCWPGKSGKDGIFKYQGKP